MKAAEDLLAYERYTTKRTKREPYEDFQNRRIAAMAEAALRAAKVRA